MKKVMEVRKRRVHERIKQRERKKNVMGVEEEEHR